MGDTNDKTDSLSYTKPESFLNQAIKVAAGIGALSGLYPRFFQTITGTDHSGFDKHGLLVYGLFLSIYVSLPIIAFVVICASNSGFIKSKGVKYGYLAAVLFYLVANLVLLFFTVSNLGVVVFELIVLAVCTLIVLIAISINRKSNHQQNQSYISIKPKADMPLSVGFGVFIIVGLGLFVYIKKLEKGMFESQERFKKYLRLNHLDIPGDNPSRSITTDPIHKSAITHINQLYQLSEDLNSLNDNLANVSERFYLKSKMNYEIERADDAIKPFSPVLDSIARSFISNHVRFNAEPHLSLLNLAVLYSGRDPDSSKYRTFLRNYDSLYARNYMADPLNSCRIEMTKEDLDSFRLDLHDDTTVGYIVPDEEDTIRKHWEPLVREEHIQPLLFTNTTYEFKTIDKYLYNVISFDSLLLIRNTAAIAMPISGDTITDINAIGKKYHLKWTPDSTKIRTIRSYNATIVRLNANGHAKVRKYLAAKINYDNSTLIHDWVKAYINYRLLKVSDESDEIYSRTSWLWSESQYKLMWMFYFTLLVMGVALVYLYTKAKTVHRKLSKSADMMSSNEGDSVQEEEGLETKALGPNEVQPTDEKDRKTLLAIITNFLILTLLLIIPLFKDINKIKINADHPYWMATLPTWSVPEYLSQAFKEISNNKDLPANTNRSEQVEPPTPPATDTSMNLQLRVIRQDEDTVAFYIREFTKYMKPPKKQGYVKN